MTSEPTIVGYFYQFCLTRITKQSAEFNPLNSNPNSVSLPFGVIFRGWGLGHGTKARPLRVPTKMKNVFAYSKGMTLRDSIFDIKRLKNGCSVIIMVEIVIAKTWVGIVSHGGHGLVVVGSFVKVVPPPTQTPTTNLPP